MSLTVISARLSEAGIQHVMVEASQSAIAKSGKYDSLKSFLKSIKNDAEKAYAQGYYDWVKGGRTGNPPACSEKNFKKLKYIRMVVNQLA